ncbi:MAG: recombinase family protein [Chloroflexota bacterium]|nr:recombinase family protein [Chloroflexota bacterium]
MPTSELVTPQHLARTAMIYIRQSSPQQVLSHQESRHLQYALKDRAVSLGWRPDDVVIIDSDLGLTATSAQHREGFKELLAQVSLGHVGIILSFDVTRLARNCSDWYPLLDLCGYKQCLIADRDGVYDPASPNGRLLLGLKGQLSELELHTIRARMTAGLLNKAERGDLALPLPVGLVRDTSGTVRKDPNRDVQDRIQLVFTTFLERRSASKVLEVFNTHDLLLPRQDRFGDIVWKPPTIAMILAILKNPAYAGAFVYGRTRTITTGPRPTDKTQQRLPIAQWRIRVNDVYPAYVPWATFEQIQGMLQDNYADYVHNQSRGIPRPGAALLHGLTYCGRCGHKLLVQYKGGTRYLCNYLRQQYRVPVCQNLPADGIDQAVVAAFFAALAPVELDAYAAAVATQQANQERMVHIQQQQLARLRYEAELAQRQFTRVDPDNRLVAAELEVRWEAALSALKQAEQAALQQQGTPILALPPDLEASFRAVGQHLPRLWEQDIIGQAHKKALLRCLIEKVVLQRAGRDAVEVRIVWKGGATTVLTVPIPVGAFTDLTGAATMEQIILEQSAQGIPDEVIAADLTAQGYRSPLRREVLPSTVRTIRLKHRQFQVRSQSHPRRVAGYLTVPQVARALSLRSHWIYDRITNGSIQVTKDGSSGLYLFPDTPETLALFRELQTGTRSQIAFV